MRVTPLPCSRLRPEVKHEAEGPQRERQQVVNGKEEVVEEVVLENRMLGRRTEGQKRGGECSTQGEEMGGRRGRRREGE